MRTVIARPASLDLLDDDIDTTYIFQAATITDEYPVQLPQLELDAGDQLKLVDIGEITLQLPGRVEMTTAPTGSKWVVRDVQPEDAVTGLPFGIPLPVPVIGALLSGDIFDVQVQALTEDDGYVATLLLVTNAGLYTRFSGQWIPLQDLDVIDGYNTTFVEPQAVDIYDAADQSGNQLPLMALPTFDDNAPVQDTELNVADVVDRTFTPDEEALPTPEVVPENVDKSPPVVEAAANLTPIQTVKDIPEALRLASIHPDIRWYVERRVKSLDPDMVMPWEETSD